MVKGEAYRGSEEFIARFQELEARGKQSADALRSFGESIHDLDEPTRAKLEEGQKGVYSAISIAGDALWINSMMELGIAPEIILQAWNKKDTKAFELRDQSNL